MDRKSVELIGLFVGRVECLSSVQNKFEIRSNCCKQYGGCHQLHMDSEIAIYLLCCRRSEGKHYFGYSFDELHYDSVINCHILSIFKSPSLFGKYFTLFLDFGIVQAQVRIFSVPELITGNLGLVVDLFWGPVAVPLLVGVSIDAKPHQYLKTVLNLWQRPIREGN
jgi:hypothetical protein